jgi:hypothetical protein
MEKNSEPTDLQTSAKWAEIWGVSPNKVKKAIQQLNIEPDMKKGVCGYYSRKTADKIKKALG